ncbi:MAG TPA: MBL fold metallo-hydrolase [Gammaproteobacteria bacterium]|nr:MBL fold metallo-hydrolase [Gammaproteobacteria bacterium]
MRFASLGSGSRGNGTLVEAGATRLLVDCGFSCRETERRLARLALQPADLSAILVTHEHSDHIAGVARFSRRHGTPVWMTAGTEAVHKGGELGEWRCFHAHESFVIDGLEVHPYPVPHDAREPCQFVFTDGDRRLGLLTDAGSVSAHMVDALQGLDALFLECNHDPAMLAAGPYPPVLKQRVAGRFGHLSNAQAAELLARIDSSALQHLVAGHLSEKNNHPELAQAALARVLGCAPTDIVVAGQDEGLDWKMLN